MRDEGHGPGEIEMTADLATTLSEAIEEDAPCGPDLDLAYDPDYSLFVARAEGLLPEKSFFDFDRTKNDLAKESSAVETLLGRTRDLRLLVLLAKLRILNRELGGFVAALTAMAALLRARWEHVHPAAEEGDFGLRIVVIESLDDTTSIIMPLLHAPLTVSRRIGAVNYRMVQIAQGEAAAREGEPAPDLQAVETAFSDGDMAGLVQNRDLVVAAAAALAEMEACIEEQNAGSLSLGRLKPTLDKIRITLDGAIVKRDPGAALVTQTAGSADAEGPDADAAGPTPSMPLDTPAGIRRALLGAELYFRTREPSSPALLLVAQARQLVGKGLAESVQLLVPEHASDATINVGGRMVFDLPIERLATLIEAGPDGETVDVEADPPAAGSRREALDILQQVATHLRAREPSSAIPLLCERARAMAERDFMSLLREMLPERAFRNLDES
jgi:type VI secretion system protein ImpA